MVELKLLIADDHELIRRGLRDLLLTQTKWQVVGEACDGVEAVEMAGKLKPDIVILDYFMPKLSGSEAAVQILAKMPDTRIVILTMDDSEQVISDALQAGVSSLVLKSDADPDLLVAVASVAENRPFFAGRVAKVILAGYLARNSEPTTKVKSLATDLTEREREVMRLLTEGMSSKKAALQMQISIRTVESHRININRKLGFTSIADLVRYAIRNGIVTHT